jgi:hypothetical protein
LIVQDTPNSAPASPAVAVVPGTKACQTRNSAKAQLSLCTPRNTIIWTLQAKEGDDWRERVRIWSGSGFL